MQEPGVIDRLKRVIKSDVEKTKSRSDYRFRKEHPKLSYVLTGRGSPEHNIQHEIAIAEDKIKKKKRRKAAVGVLRSVGKKVNEFGEREAKEMQRGYTRDEPRKKKRSAATPYRNGGEDWRLSTKTKKLWWQD